MTQREYSLEAGAASERPVSGTDFQLPAEATLAGLTPLVPVPLLDWWLEARFQNRMVERIAERRGRRLDPAVREVLSTGGRSFLSAGLLFLLKLPARLLLRLVRKLVYVLAIKEATEKISFYWQRAFLIDHMLQAGHLEDVASARRAQEAMQAAMRGLSSPLTSLSKQVAQRIWQMGPFRRSSPVAGLSAASAEQRGFITRQWAKYDGFLVQLAERYDQAYAARSRMEA
jgi:hypothetical protein